MQNTITSILNALAAKLGKVSPFAKAIVPSVGGLVGALANMAIAGSFNTASILTLAGGVAVSVVTYFVPNAAKPTPTPTPSPVPAKASGPVANGYLVVSTVTAPTTKPGVSTGTFYYIGPFADLASAQTHADEHSKQANTVATVQTLVNPANC